MNKKIYFSIFILGVLLSSCKKDNKNNNTNNPSGPTKNGTTLQLITDSIYLYSKEDYLWYDGLPSYSAFNPRQYATADNISALQKEVDAISQFKTNPATGKPYEYNDSYPGESKYSFIDEGQTATTLGGTKGDFGLGLGYYKIATDLRVRYVYPNSPAATARIHRGDQVTQVNNLTSVDGSDNTAYNNLVAALSSSTITLHLKRPDGSTYTANLTTASYTVNPVFMYKVFDQGNGKKVGYIVFNSFTVLTNAQPQLDAAFNYFVSNNITDLVVDLRYNGGGAVETAEYLDNLIVPPAKDKTPMYSYYFNDILTSGKEVLLRNQWRRDQSSGQDYNYGQFDYSVAGNQMNFAKKNTLNINRIFFIVTGSTASASELTINNLRPEMNVQLIGRTTYGKPVGFFDIDINKYQLYIPEFETKNSAGQGGYYAGMVPGTADYPGVNDADDLSKDFGDPTEGLLAHALNYVNNGTFGTSKLQVESTGGNALALHQTETLNTKFDARTFNGMVVFHKKFKGK